MRKLFSLFLALVATTPLWAYDFQSGNLYYNITSGTTVEVTSQTSSYPYNEGVAFRVATIPSTVTHNGTTYNVTSIGEWAFGYSYSLTSITIPNSVTSIGNYAFYGCTSLTSITIPNSVESTGRSMCSYCYDLCSVTIGNSLKHIGLEAFYSCSSLTSITIPNSVTSIGDYAFHTCSSLASVTIPYSVTSIGEKVFFKCSSLDSIYVEAPTPPALGEETFKNTPASICYVPCGTLTAYEASDWAQYVSEFVEDCKVDSTMIITYTSTNGNVVTPYTSDVFGVNILSNEYKDGQGVITFDGPVTSIGDSAFYDCSSLISIVIPESVTSIEDYAFYGCTSLVSITCEATTPPILGTDVFYDTKLSAVYIPDNTLSAYQQVWGAKYTYINNETILTLHVATPGTLSDLIFDAGTRPINVVKLTLTGTLNDDDFTCMRETMTSLEDVDLLGITNTSGVNFKNKTNLVRVVLPANLTSIGEWAFELCTSLTSVTIGNSVTSIGDGAFYYCSSLTSITIPNSVTSIGWYAFGSCHSLTSVTIPNSVTSIGYSAFASCSSRTTIVVEVGNQVYDSRDNCNAIIETATNTLIAGCKNTIIPNSVTSIGDGAFYYCSSLTSITIPNSVTSIGNSAFLYCSSLTSITIPNSVTNIGDETFRGCSSLTSITIPNSVISIGDEAFDGCSLTSITCLGTTPPKASDLGAPTSTCTLTVPQSAYNAYLRHAYWGQFLNIYTGYLVTLQANNDQWGEVTGDGLYTNDTTITITATPYEGYTFLRWSDGNTDNPRTIQVTSDTTLTAEFAIEGGCLVTFMDWDGTVLSSVSVAPGEAATAPADPTREGYTFIGWDKDFSAVTDHMTVTAQYQINRYRVRFFDDDNTLLKTDTVEYQSAAVAPANPYHEGYTFTGWDKTFDSITADLDIYAQYEMGENRELTVIYTNSEDNDSEIYSQSLTITIPAAPEIEGFTFLYWQPVAEPLTDTITIQAIYEANTPTSAPEVYINPANPAQKLLRNGQVYILKDDKTYTIMGAQIQ